MKAHETPSGTRMMWKARVNAICARAHGTGSTAATSTAPPSIAFTSRFSLASVRPVVPCPLPGTGPAAAARRRSGGTGSRPARPRPGLRACGRNPVRRTPHTHDHDVFGVQHGDLLTRDRSLRRCLGPGIVPFGGKTQPHRLRDAMPVTLRSRSRSGPPSRPVSTGWVIVVPHPHGGRASQPYAVAPWWSRRQLVETDAEVRMSGV